MHQNMHARQYCKEFYDVVCSGTPAVHCCYHCTPFVGPGCVQVQVL